MSLWTKVKFYILRKSARDRAEWAYGLWLVSPRTTSATKFISNITGIPTNMVWDIIYGKKD